MLRLNRRHAHVPPTRVRLIGATSWATGPTARSGELHSWARSRRPDPVCVSRFAKLKRARRRSPFSIYYTTCCLPLRVWKFVIIKEKEATRRSQPVAIANPYWHGGSLCTTSIILAIKFNCGLLTKISICKKVTGAWFSTSSNAFMVHFRKATLKYMFY